MGFLSWWHMEMIRLRSRLDTRAVAGSYEPWACDAIDRFEREIEAFCRRSGFFVVM
jgi:hypothetical protein